MLLTIICFWVCGILIGVGGTMVWMSYHSKEGYDFTEVLLCLTGAKYCMTHDVMDTTKEFEVRHIKALIEELEGR